MNDKMKVLIAFGTRPEAIKMAPIVIELAQRQEFQPVVCATSQHRQMQDQALEVFGISPDYDLDLMKPGQSLNEIVANVLCRIPSVLEQEKPDCVLVQGDTSTAFAVSLAAFHSQIMVGHVEAGLRTYRRYQPFPEEVNRKMVSATATVHFTPTEHARQNLLREGHDEASIFVTGNTVVDALQWVLARTKFEVPAELENFAFDEPFILVTGHRRESFGEGFRNICLGLKAIAARYPSIPLLYPVHLNPNVREPVYSLLGDVPNMHLVSPIAYTHFVHLLKQAKLIISDSGGIQEEAAALGKPVLVMRDVTERPEAVEAGVSKLVGTDPERILREASRLLEDESAYRKASAHRELFGDGSAAKQIADVLCPHPARTLVLT